MSTCQNTIEDELLEAIQKGDIEKVSYILHNTQHKFTVSVGHSVTVTVCEPSNRVRQCHGQILFFHEAIILDNWTQPSSRTNTDTSDSKSSDSTRMSNNRGHVAAAIVELLLADTRFNSKSVVQQQDHLHHGRTPLILACQVGYDSVVKLLVEHPDTDQVYINHSCKYGRTALMCASSLGHLSVVDTLLSTMDSDSRRINKSSMIAWTDIHGRTALYHAAAKRRTAIVELFMAHPDVDEAIVNHATRDGDTILMVAAKRGFIGILELLLADPRITLASFQHTDNGGLNAFVCAAKSGRTKVIELLLADARVTRQTVFQMDHFGQSALIHAAYYGQLGVVALLLGSRHFTWHYIYNLLSPYRNYAEMKHLIASELNRRRMCIIFPSATLGNAVRPRPSVGTQSQGTGVGTGTRTGMGALQSESDSDSPILRSFVKSSIFDVNVLGIARQYL
jgi:ankyrin repeat protein